MSDVRLSNGSPPLERVEPRAEGHSSSKPSVCRNLFGSPDPEEVRQAYLDELRESEMAYRDKYNFDFANDTPLEPGTYEWESLDARDAPDVYSRPPRESRRLDVNNTGNQTSPPETCPKKAQSAAKKRPSVEDSDCARESKRMNRGGEEDYSEERAEQTPRKSDPST